MQTSCPPLHTYQLWTTFPLWSLSRRRHHYLLFTNLILELLHHVTCCHNYVFHHILIKPQAHHTFTSPLSSLISAIRILLLNLFTIPGTNYPSILPLCACHFIRHYPSLHTSTSHLTFFFHHYLHHFFHHVSLPHMPFTLSPLYLPIQRRETDI